VHVNERCKVADGAPRVVVHSTDLEHLHLNCLCYTIKSWT